MSAPTLTVTRKEVDDEVSFIVTSPGLKIPGLGPVPLVTSTRGRHIAECLEKYFKTQYPGAKVTPGDDSHIHLGRGSCDTTLWTKLNCKAIQQVIKAHPLMLLSLKVGAQPGEFRLLTSWELTSAQIDNLAQALELTVIPVTDPPWPNSDQRYRIVRKLGSGVGALSGEYLAQLLNARLEK